MQDKNKNAVGRVHQTLYQFLEMQSGSISPMPQEFVQTVVAYERVKIARSKVDRLVASMVRALEALTLYMTTLGMIKGQNNGEVQRLSGVQASLRKSLDEYRASEGKMCGCCVV